MFDLSQLLGTPTAPVTIAEAHVQVTWNGSALEIIVDGEKLGPATLAPIKEEIDLGSLVHVAVAGVGGLISKLLKKQ